MRINSAKFATPTPQNRASMPVTSQAPDGYSSELSDASNLGSVVKHDVLSVVRGGVGMLGAGIGGVMGVIPGVGYGTARLFGDKSSSSHLEACDAGDWWKISYFGAGALAGGTVGALLTGNGLGGVVGAVGAGLAGLALQGAFRALGQSSVRLPYDTETFPSTLTFCADKEMARQVSNPINGLLVGIKEGAHLGKLALQDRLVPSLQPSRYSSYR